MKKAILLLILSLFVAGAGAQDKKPLPVSASAALKIRDAQIRVMELNAQMEPMRTRLALAQAALMAAVKGAYADAKVEPDKFRINDATWEFEIIDVPKVAPKEEAKPAAAKETK